MTDAELRNLLSDCVVLWAVPARIEAAGSDVLLHAPDGTYTATSAPAALRPVRWFLQTPERAAAGRPARALPSIVALLSALRNAIGAEGGARLRVGAD
jgi:hypothetical protein